MPRDFRPTLLPAASRASRFRGALFSAVVHLGIFAALGVVAWQAPQIARFRLPGTPKGTVQLTWYSPGSRHPAATTTPIHHERAVHTASQLRQPQPLVAPPSPQPPAADPGTGKAADSGLGEGDIRIALSQVSPSPHPDLSVVPHGTRGDVVVDAVIDEHGRITALTLLRRLAPSIDQEVIATVKGWLFTPATKDGVPVASEQEFLFHYERG